MARNIPNCRCCDIMRGPDELDRKVGYALIFTFFLCMWILMIIPMVELLGLLAFPPWLLIFVIWFIWYDYFLLDGLVFKNIRR